MLNVSIDGLQLYPLLNGSTAGVIQGSFSRHGGTSQSPFNSHNISFGVGDEIENVKFNRCAIKKYLGLDYLVSAHQIHGDEIYVVNEPIDEDMHVSGYDALITSLPRIGLMIGHADCQAVLLYDKNRKVIAAIHCGWRGSVADIVKTTISVLEEQFQTNPSDLLAGVGPSLGPCCSEFVNHSRELPKSFRSFQVKENHFDFWQITRHQLRECGVGNESIFILGACTSCSADFFSYRRACRMGTGVTGRNGSVIALL